MNASTRTPLLTLALRVFGLIFMFGIVVLNRVWPAGWAWQPEQPAYLRMILSIYFVLGIFLLRAARDPARHLSLIWFTVWSSLAHAAVMAYHSFTDAGQMGHLWGDVAALVLTAVVLTVLVRRELPATGRAELRAAVAR
jgi:uncharacterized protein DUF6632